MKVTYDREAQAMYFKFGDRGKNGTCEDLMPDEVILDKNQRGEITGIEILDVEAIEDVTRKRHRKNQQVIIL